MSALHPQTRGAWDRAVARSRAADTDDDPVRLLPDGYDPDGYVRAFGIEALRALLGASPPPALFPPETPLERERRETWEARLNDVGMHRLRERCRSGAALEDAAIVDDARERKMMAERERQERELQAIRDRLGARQRGADVETRARKYVATMDACSSEDAMAAARVLVRGFALPESVALAIFREDFIPRLQRKGKTTKRDVIGWIQRAGRSRLPLGYLLERKR